ncbi:MAG TPA: CvpA family protein [Candidatus Dormibacteraeota bacterium]|nr:CvpA family protein [Candidatus Dormibacteraeota bacterium]
MFIDIAVGLLILVALFLGYQRGVIQPLMAEIFFFGTLLLVFRFHDQYTNEMQNVAHINAVISVFAALIGAVILGGIGGAIGGRFHRMESIRGIDGLLGIFVHVIVMLVVIYLGISALVTLDNAFVPTLNKATLTLDQVNQLESVILSNPITSALVSKDDLDALKKAAQSTNGANIESVNGIKQLKQIYTNFLEPQLHSSRTVPIILGIGQHLPLIGHVGPNDLHPAPPSPTPTQPCPTPSPTRSPSPSRTPTPKVTPKPSPTPTCAPRPSPTK